MKLIMLLLCSSMLISIGCRGTHANGQTYDRVETEHYVRIEPRKETKATLVLFPGYPENPTIIEREFEIVAPAISAGVSVVFMKFNQRIWLEETEKQDLAEVIRELIGKQAVGREHVTFGGFSSGGNIALLLSDYLIGVDHEIQPEGVFIIDSPVDLLNLYENAKRNVQRNFSAGSVAESTMIINQFDNAFGDPLIHIDQYETHSPYIQQTQNTDNVRHLKDVKIRFYSEPDTTWWKENRMNEYEDMNAYSIERLQAELMTENYGQVKYIRTKNKGYRANGTRHPHSWSIVDVDQLLQWILEE